MTTATADAPKSKAPIRKIAKPAGRTTLAKVGVAANHKWVIVDATGKTLGRLASEVAIRLMGKHKVTYTPTVDVGDFVIVINTAKTKVSGRKADQREYDYYTYYPGGHGIVTLRDLQAKHPNKVFELAVRRMLPKTTMGVSMFKKLKCYRDADHPHTAQRPEKLDL
jgi:large subunit ribosomal protein L13